MEELRHKVVEIAARASRAGLMPGTMGNFSARDSETGYVAITPSGYSYDVMKSQDVVVFNAEGKMLDGDRKPSFESPMHLRIYRDRPDINGVVHAHSPYSNAMGLLRREIPPVLLTLAHFIGGNVPIADYEPSGTEDIGAHALEVMGDRPAVILEKHGVLTIASSLDLAYEIAAAVEDGARVYHLALQIARPKDVLKEIPQGKGRA
jgi:L-ribulose-5-phosphate 4-epimerase